MKKKAKTGLGISVSMRVYYSSYHLWSAEHFAQLVKNLEDAHEGRPIFNVQQRAYVTGAIFSSVAFLEAAINEIFKDAADGHLSYIGTLQPQAITAMASFWKPEDRTSLLEKYQVALDYTGNTRFDKGKHPYQKIRLLIDLRDALVHYKPESIGLDDTHHKFERNLKREFPINKMMIGTGNPYFPDKCLGYGCCIWALEQSRGFADTFFETIGVVPNYQKTELDK